MYLSNQNQYGDHYSLFSHHLQMMLKPPRITLSSSSAEDGRHISDPGQNWRLDNSQLRNIEK